MTDIDDPYGMGTYEGTEMPGMGSKPDDGEYGGGGDGGEGGNNNDGGDLGDVESWVEDCVASETKPLVGHVAELGAQIDSMTKKLNFVVSYHMQHQNDHGKELQ